LEYAVSLLSDDDSRVIDYFTTKSDRGESRMESMISGRTARSMRRNTMLTQEKSFTTFMSGDSSRKKKKMKLKSYELSTVRYKCLVTIVSLLESNYSQTGFADRIMRAIPLSVLTNNLAQVFKLYKKLYKNGEYRVSAFNHVDDDFQKDPDNTDEEKEFIIENGFNIYILINLFLDNQKQESVEDDELNEFIK